MFSGKRKDSAEPFKRQLFSSQLAEGEYPSIILVMSTFTIFFPNIYILIACYSGSSAGEVEEVTERAEDVLEVGKLAPEVIHQPTNEKKIRPKSPFKQVKILPFEVSETPALKAPASPSKNFLFYTSSLISVPVLS